MEQQQKMNDSKYTTFMKGDLRSDVIKIDGHWGCRFWHGGSVVKTEFYKGHSEAYAESAAENYVDGIKKI